MRKLRIWAALGMLAAVGMLDSGRAQAQVMADRLPASTVAYVSWAGSDALGESYQASHLKGLLDNLGLIPLITQQVQMELKGQDPAAQEKVQLVMDMLGDVAKSPTAFYFGPIDFSNPGQPMPRIAIISRMGAEKSNALAAKLSAIIDQNKLPGGPPLVAKGVGEYFLFYLGDANLEKELTGPAPGENLAATDGFKKAMSQMGPNVAKSALIAYIDGPGALGQVEGAMQVLPNEVRRLWPVISQGAGITSLKQVAYSGGFDGPNWRSDAFIGMGDQRNGLLAFLDNPPLTDDTYRLIPKSATWAGVFHFDGVRVLNDVRTIAGKVNDRGEKMIDDLLQQAFAWTGIDVKNDFLPSLGDQIIMYGSPDATGNSLRGVTLVNRLRNVDKAMASLTAAENLLNLIAVQRDPNTKAQFRMEALPAPNDKIMAHVLPLEGSTPAWAISDGVLYISLSVAGLQSAVEAGGGRGGKGIILENPQFAELKKKLGQNEISSFNFVDLSKTSGESYELITQMLTNQFAINPDAPSRYHLPPLEKLTPDLGPSLNVSWTDQAGFHSRESSPFPYAQGLHPMQFLLLRLAATGTVQTQRVPATRTILP